MNRKRQTLGQCKYGICTTKACFCVWNNKGFVLSELVVVVGILSILATLTIPRFVGFHRKAEEQACASNRKSIERLYTFKLKNSDLEFEQYIIENFDPLCPKDGIYTYSQGNVNCSVHNEDSIEEPVDPIEEVPWL